MPQKQEKPKVIDTKPSPSIIRRLLNSGAVSERTQGQYPELGAAWANMERTMPRETAATHRIAPMGSLGKLLYGNAYAVANPLTRTIGVNRELIAKDKQNLEDILTHELTHIHQKPSIVSGLKKLYTAPENQPEEIEALEAERKRPRARLKDIYLPPEKKKVK